MVFLGNSTVIQSATGKITHPSVLRLVREQSIDHQIIYLIFHHLVNHDDVSRTLREPKTELEEFFKRGIMYCFSLEPNLLGSIIESTPPPYNLALIHNMFRTALFLGDGPILNLIMNLSREDFTNQLVLLEGAHYYPVQYTSDFGHVQATQVLLEHGADPNLRPDRKLGSARSLDTEYGVLSSIGSMPSTKKPSTEARVQILRLLISRGLRVENFVVVYKMNSCAMEELEVLITYCMENMSGTFGSFQSFFKNHGLINILNREGLNDSFSETMRAILEQASSSPKHDQELWDSVLSRSLSLAILRNYGFAVDILLAMGASPDAECMINAVQSNNLRMLEDCLDRGINPNSPNEGRTALSEAIKHHSRGPVQMLHARGFISELVHQSTSFVAAFVAACQLGDVYLIEYLLSLQSFPRKLFGIAQALEAALECEQNHIVEKLISLGITPTIRCLELAIRNKQLATFSIIHNCTDLPAMLEMTSQYFRGSGEMRGRLYGNTIIFEAIQWDDSTVIQSVLSMEYPVNTLLQLDYRNFSSWSLASDMYAPGHGWTWYLTPLSAAILKGNKTAMDALMAHGRQAVTFNSQLTSYQTLFLTEGMYGKITLTPLAAGVIRTDVPLIEALLRIGADPFDNSALFACAIIDSPDIVTVLLSAFKTRYPNSERSFGCDALYQIILRKNLRLLRLLATLVNLTGYVEKDSGPLYYPDLRPRSDTVFTSPLGEAIRVHAESNGADGALDYLLPLVKDYDAIVYRDFNCGNMTCVLYAIFLDSLETVQKLHRNGANVFLPAERNIPRTPIQAAAQAGSTDIVEYLLSQGVSANEPPSTRAGATALQLAAITGNVGVAIVLLKAEANINASPAFFDGRTAFEGATEHGRIEMMIFLADEGADLLANGNIQYRRAIAFAEENRQYAAKDLADKLFARALARQEPSFLGMSGEWAGGIPPNEPVHL